MSVLNWSTIADDNGDSDPAINFAEGQMPSTVNNSARSMMAALAAYFADAGGKLISGGSSNAYTLTTNMGVTALGSPLTLMFEADRANTGAATLAVDGLTAKPLRNQSNTALSSGDMADGGVYLAVYNGAADAFLLANVSVAATDQSASSTKTADYTVGATDKNKTILVAPAANMTITLPAISSVGKFRVRLQRVTAPGFSCTVSTTGADTINGGASYSLYAEYLSFDIISDGVSDWYIAFVLPPPESIYTELLLDGAVSTAKVADEAITYAKFQDISTAARVLGRKTVGAGAVEEITATEFLDFVGTTRGSIAYRGASGWTILTPGTAGTILTSNGAGKDPSYASAADAGKVGQVLQTQYTANTAITANIPADTSIPTSSEGTQVLSRAITPASSSSTIRVSAAIGGLAASSGAQFIASLFRGTTCLDVKAHTANAANNLVFVGFDVLDAPATASAVTYSVRIGASTGNSSGNSPYFSTAQKCSLTLMEILP